MQGARKAMANDATPLLDLPHILPSQAQKHVTHNEALSGLDAVVQLSVKDRTQTAPPGSPLVEGDRFLIAEPATGGFAGYGNQIAYYAGGAFAFLAPREGWLCWIEAETLLLVFHGGSWQPVPGAAVTMLPLLGINAAAGETNRLVVQSPASLFTHDGAGHQLKINKSAVAGAASLLFQTAFSGRAEIGLIGDDDFVFKVSPDGSTFVEAIRIAAADGVATLKMKPPAARVYAASATWTKPAGLKTLLSLVVGAGGGGGGTVGNNGDPGAGGGGGAGGASVSLYDAAALGSNVAVTVGAGGNGGVGAPGTGATGGTSAFGPHNAASGGVGGLSRVAHPNLPAAPGGSGGVGSGGNLWNSAGAGGTGWQAPLLDLTSGSGGDSFIGAGGPGTNPSSGTVVAGEPGRSPGAGGSGSAVRGVTSATGTGGKGGDGLVVLIELY